MIATVYIEWLTGEYIHQPGNNTILNISLQISLIFTISYHKPHNSWEGIHYVPHNWYHHILATKASSPVRCSSEGRTLHFLKNSSAKLSTTNSFVSSPPAFMAATTSECCLPSMDTPFTCQDNNILWDHREGGGQFPREAATLVWESNHMSTQIMWWLRLLRFNQGFVYIKRGGRAFKRKWRTTHWNNSSPPVSIK